MHSRLHVYVSSLRATPQVRYGSSGSLNIQNRTLRYVTRGGKGLPVNVNRNTAPRRPLDVYYWYEPPISALSSSSPFRRVVESSTWRIHLLRGVVVHLALNSFSSSSEQSSLLVSRCFNGFPLFHPKEDENEIYNFISTKRKVVKDFFYKKKVGWRKEVVNSFPFASVLISYRRWRTSKRLGNREID